MWSVLIILLIIGSITLYKLFSAETKVKVAFPYSESVANNTSFACQSLIDSSATGSKEESLTNGIEYEVRKGTNKASIKIKDDKTITFLSGASFDTGESGGVDFQIIKNDSKELVAALWNDNSMNSIVINKDNGLAVWSKIRSEFPGYGAPTSDSSYMSCK